MFACAPKHLHTPTSLSSVPSPAPEPAFHISAHHHVVDRRYRHHVNSRLAHEAPAKEAVECKAAVEAAPQRETAADEAAVQQKAGLLDQ